MFIGLGSNLGDRHRVIVEALDYLDRHPAMALRRHSRLIETEPWGVTEQPRFINAVAEIATPLEPNDLLHALKRAERSLGRIPSATRWGPREIDLDILLYGNRIVSEPHLTIPHAALLQRRFVVEQILELDGSAVHPVAGKPLMELLFGME